MWSFHRNILGKLNVRTLWLHAAKLDFGFNIFWRSISPLVHFLTYIYMYINREEAWRAWLDDAYRLAFEELISNRVVPSNLATQLRNDSLSLCKLKTNSCYQLLLFDLLATDEGHNYLPSPFCSKVNSSCICSLGSALLRLLVNYFGFIAVTFSTWNCIRSASLQWTICK